MFICPGTLATLKFNHHVHPKPTHNDEYLHQRSFHHPDTKSLRSTPVSSAEPLRSATRTTFAKSPAHQAALRLNGYTTVSRPTFPHLETLGSAIPEPQPPLPLYAYPTCAPFHTTFALYYSGPVSESFTLRPTSCKPEF